jgi:hypothetical protein
MGDNLKMKTLFLLVLLVLFMNTAAVAPKVFAAAPEFQITPEQRVEPTIIIPDTGQQGLDVDGWIIWLIFLIFALVILISLVIRGETQRGSQW